jgi:hypothetical protein
MGNEDEVLVDFMMSQVPDEGKSQETEGGEQSKKGKEKNKNDPGEELSEEEKEKQEAKKKAAATLNSIPFNVELAKIQFKKLLFFYSLAGLFVIGMMFYSRRHRGWASRGITKGINLIMFGNANAR